MPQLEQAVTNLDNVPEGLHEYYVKQESGGYKLNLPDDGGLQEAKLKTDEFRANNVKLLKDIEKVEIEKNEMLTKLELLSKKKDDPPEKKDNLADMESMFSERTKKMVEDNETQRKAQNDIIKEAQDKLTLTQSALHKSELRSQLTIALDGVGNLQTGARGFVDDLASRVWKLEDSKWVPRDIDTGNILYGSDGTSAMTMTEWVPYVRKHNTFLWDSSQGGGAIGSTKNNFVNGDMANATPQAQLHAYHQQAST